MPPSLRNQAPRVPHPPASIPQSPFGSAVSGDYAYRQDKEFVSCSGDVDPSACEADRAAWVQSIDDITIRSGSDFYESQSIALYRAATEWSWGDGVAKVSLVFRDPGLMAYLGLQRGTPPEIYPGAEMLRSLLAGKSSGYTREVQAGPRVKAATTHNHLHRGTNPNPIPVHIGNHITTYLKKALF